jgi:hypothetical protein
MLFIKVLDRMKGVKREFRDLGIRKVIILIFLLSFGYGLKLFLTNPTQLTPYPYYFEERTWSGSQLAENAHILIIGDRMGAELNPYTQTLVEKVRQNITSPIRVYNWSRNNEGLHRTLAKMKSLKKIPLVVIYHGGSQEFNEKKFDILDYEKIKKNFKKSKDQNLNILLLKFPWISRFIFPLSKYQTLNEYKEDLRDFKAFQKQKQIEIEYLLYEHELKDLIDFVYSKDSHLYLLTTPLNLDVGPKEPCQNATNQDFNTELDKIEKTFNDGKTKEALKKLKTFRENTIGNARANYLFGKISLSLGNFEIGEKALYLATAWDCSTWRSSIVFNKIIKNLGYEFDTPVIDFNKMINLKYKEEINFDDEIFPKEEFYHQLIDHISKNIIKFF